MNILSYGIACLLLNIVTYASDAEEQGRNADAAAASVQWREATLQRYLEKIRNPQELGDIRYVSMLRDLDFPPSCMIDIYIGLLDNNWDWVQQRSLEELTTFGRAAKKAKTPALALLNAE